jgi:branched-chain amino acid transport system permease protein
VSFDWLFLFEISLAGLGTGALYALTGLAFVTIYKATRVVNLAIGEMLMIGAYLFFTFAGGLALPAWAAISSR